MCINKLGSLIKERWRPHQIRQGLGVVYVRSYGPVSGMHCGGGGYDDGLDVKFRSVAGTVGRPGATVGIENEIPGVVSLLQGQIAKKVGHLAIHNGPDCRRSFRDGHIERFGNLLPNHVFRFCFVQPDSPLKEIVRIDDSQSHVRIRHRRFRPSLVVAYRSWKCARAGRTHPDVSPLNMGYAASSGPDSVDIDHRGKDMILFNNRCGGDQRATIHNKPDIKTRSTHIGRNDISMTEDFREMQGADDAAGGAGGEKCDRTIWGLPGRERTPDRIHNQEGAL